MIDQLRTKVQNLNAADAQEADDWNGVPHRYVAVSE
jgi:outer membrane murein-binding lipoprotein Lpp